MHYAYLLFFVIIVMPAPTLQADEIIVLNGTPIIQSKGNPEESNNKQLSESQRNEYRLLITKDGDKYFWTTRKNRPLIKTQSGDISIFLEPGGSGYIRVSEREGQILYLEHMAYGFQTVNYWGTAVSFSP